MFSLHLQFINFFKKKFIKFIIYNQLVLATFLTCEIEKIQSYFITNWVLNYVYSVNRPLYNSEKDFLIIVYNYNVAAVKEFVILLRKESWFDTKFPFQKLLVNFFVPFHKETFKDNWGYINLIGKLKLIYNFLFGKVNYIWVYNYSWYNYIFYYKKNFTGHAKKFLPSITDLKYYLYHSYLLIKNIIIPIIVSLLFILLLIDYFSVNFLKQIAVWIVVGLLFFWLMSGFNFFLKRYRFGKFTSAIQRFWKRTNAYFWLIEGFLFILFFYYYLNSSQEVLYMFDESNLNQTFLLPITAFYLNLILLIILIIYSYYVLHNLVNYSYKQLLIHLTVITLTIIYIFLAECYQFYYVLTFFFENTLSLDEDHNSWVLTVDNPKIRLKQQYFLLALIAKYWHFLFIFFSWLFLVIKSYEQKRIYYNLFSLNIQNLLLLLLLNTLFITNWLKWLVRRFYDVSYYWFFTDYNNWSVHYQLSELYLIIGNLLN